ncbi:MAG: glutamate--cysteine ligase [Alkalinema sp. CACIAM 70d]|nr:MAG: glutamate--cysteine ligase [Alkalinema sp. CACIAM 70d]
MQFKFGIEHEVAFVRSNGEFADFTNTTYGEFAKIVERLPEYQADAEQLRIGDAGIRRKRWYIEGIERFDPLGNLVNCVPKGIEIRTTIQTSIADTIAELTTSFQHLQRVAQEFDLTPTLTSFNPNQTQFIPDPPLNGYEQQRLNSSPEDRTEHLPMVTYGPDLNLSVVGASMADLVDWGRKLTYYSPYILPFSYGRSIYQGKPWSGQSVRTFYRTGARPAALVFVASPQDIILSDPSLTKLAQIPAEVGRIEFKAFDSCELPRYGSLLALLKGLILDRTLPGRATVPDRVLHQRSAQYGFDDPDIATMAQTVLTTVNQVLEKDSDRVYLEQLSVARHAPEPIDYLHSTAGADC